MRQLGLSQNCLVTDAPLDTEAYILRMLSIVSLLRTYVGTYHYLRYRPFLIFTELYHRLYFNPGYQYLWCRFPDLASLDEPGVCLPDEPAFTRWEVWTLGSAVPVVSGRGLPNGLDRAISREAPVRGCPPRCASLPAPSVPTDHHRHIICRAGAAH